MSTVGVFDLVSGEARLLFDTFRGAIEPFAVAHGLLYYAPGDAIVSVDLADCAVTTIMTRPKATRISALTLDGGDLFWAERYDGTALGSRVFARQADGTEVRLGQVSGTVEWIGVDSQTVYWTVKPESGRTDALVRRRRP